LRRVAPSLEALPWQVVYVGGATTHLYLTDPAAPPPTATQDVDVVVDVHTRLVYETDLHEALRKIGAREDTSEDAPICRWLLSGIRVDIMAPDASVLGFSNRWYPAALAHSTLTDIGDGVSIRLVTAPYFLATKADAFNSRGREDFISSKDVEDFIAVVDGRLAIVDEVRASATDVRDFLRQTAVSWLASDAFGYAVEGYLQGDRSRVDIVLQKMARVAR
jgi:hypothetical protein